MEYVIGALSTVGFFILLSLCIYIGYKVGRKKTVPPPMTDIEREKIKRLNNDFVSIMNYDVSKAVARKQVT